MQPGCYGTILVVFQSKLCCILGIFCLPSPLGVCLLLLSLLVPLLMVIQCDFTMSFPYFKVVEVCVAAWNMPEISGNISRARSEPKFL